MDNAICELLEYQKIGTLDDGLLSAVAKLQDGDRVFYRFRGYGIDLDRALSEFESLNDFAEAMKKVFNVTVMPDK